MAGWPAAGEEIAVARDIALAELTGCRLHLAHVSTAGALELVRAAKARGVAVTCEVTPHHLFLTEDDLTPEYDTNFKMNPPLRTEADRAGACRRAGRRHGRLHRHRPRAARAAREGARVRAGAVRHDGARDGASARDHATWSLAGLIDWADLVRLMAHGPRAALGLPPVSPRGRGASPTSRSSTRRRALKMTPAFFESKSVNSAFLGATLLGKASEVLVDGQFALRNGKVVDVGGSAHRASGS